MRRIKYFLVFLVVCSTVEFGTSNDFYLRNGDRVVFYGDSITQDGRYGLFVEQFVSTRFPHWDVRFFYSGVGGDRVTGGSAGGIEQRLLRDVVAHRPTVVTIMLGMNDAGYQPFNEDLYRTYCDGLSYIVLFLKEKLPEVRLTLIQPSPFDDINWPPQFQGGYDQVLRKYGEYVAHLAARTDSQLVDFGSSVNEGLRRLAKENLVLGRQVIPDRVHPEKAGHLLMGATLLRS